MDSTEFMRQARKYHNRYDAIILDPPRAGTTKDFIECATALNPRKFYIFLVIQEHRFVI